VPTEAVFSVDDDIQLSCRDMELAMSAWRTAPRAMVGFVPRLHSHSDAAPAWRYHRSAQVYWNGAYVERALRCCCY